MRAGCDAVKFQKRTPELCVPLDQWNVMRDTPWGRMSYIDYKRKIEFGEAEFQHIDQLCKRLGILWFASCWDLPSIELIERFAPPCYKAASASLTDHELLRGMKATGKPLMISTGMSSIDEIDAAISAVGHKHLLIAHSTSTYPCPVDELNLRMIRTLKREYPRCPIGYSGHETGLAPTWAASRWAPPSSSGTSRSIARCGGPTTRLRSSCRGSSGWSGRFATWSAPSATASSASTTASCRFAKAAPRCGHDRRLRAHVCRGPYSHQSSSSAGRSC